MFGGTPHSMVKDQKWKAQQLKQLTVKQLKYCFDSNILLLSFPTLIFGFSSRLGYNTVDGHPLSPARGGGGRGNAWWASQVL